MSTEEMQTLVEEGIRLQSDGELEDALARFKQAFLLDTKDLRLREKIAELLAQLGRTRNAIREYRLIASYHAAEGELLSAIAASRKILQLDPAHTQTQDALATLYAMQRGGAEQSAAEAGEPNKVRLELDRDEQKSALWVDVSLLPRMPLFSALSKEAFISLVEQLETSAVADGARVITEGDDDRSMYVVVRGSFRVVREGGVGDEGEVLGHLGPGAFFGEMALLRDLPRSCSIVAEGSGLLLELDREGFERICASHPSAVRVIEASFKERLVADLLRSSAIFQAIPEQAHPALVERSELLVAEAGTTLLEQGAAGGGLYVLLRGRCDVLHRQKDGTVTPYSQMSEGDVFGEISLIHDTPCTATVRAESRSILLEIPKASVTDLLARYPEAKAAMVQLTNQRLKRTVRLTRLLA